MPFRNHAIKRFLPVIFTIASTKTKIPFARTYADPKIPFAQNGRFYAYLRTRIYMPKMPSPACWKKLLQTGLGNGRCLLHTYSHLKALSVNRRTYPTFSETVQGRCRDSSGTLHTRCRGSSYTVFRDGNTLGSNLLSRHKKAAKLAHSLVLRRRAWLLFLCRLTLRFKLRLMLSAAACSGSINFFTAFACFLSFFLPNTFFFAWL